MTDEKSGGEDQASSAYPREAEANEAMKTIAQCDIVNTNPDPDEDRDTR